MRGGTHAQRIADLLIETPGLDDDEIARALGIQPRQIVNQVCRQLAAKGALRRERSASGKIGNFILDIGVKPSAVVWPARRRLESTEASLTYPLLPHDLTLTLLIIPCSGAKRSNFDTSHSDSSILQSLPPDLRSEFLENRARIRERVLFNEDNPVAAWQRYDGALYQAGREAIGAFLRAGAHILILSGGYGVALATEPIGVYEAVLNPSWWPKSIIERVLLAYVESHGLNSVRAITSATGPYMTILHRVGWKDAGVSDVFFISPHVEPGAMRKSPATQGEAITALYAGALDSNWISSYRLGINIQVPN